MKQRTFGAAVISGWFLLLATCQLAAQGSVKDYRHATNFSATMRGKVFLDRVRPNWLSGDERMWYRRDLRENREFILVDCKTGKRGPAFDHTKVAAALELASGQSVNARKMPFPAIALRPDLGLVFQAFDKVWQCDLGTFECKEAASNVTPPKDSEQARNNRGRRGGNRGGRRRGRRDQGAISSNGVRATIKGHNLVLDGEQITKDGDSKHYYEAPRWSPDGQVLVFFKTVAGDVKEVPLINSSPRDQLTAKFSTRSYPRPGDRFPARRLMLFHVETKTVTPAQTDPIDFGGAPRPRWSADRKTFTFDRTDRGHKRYRIFEVTAATGATRTILDEEHGGLRRRRHLHQRMGASAITVPAEEHYANWSSTSERDGWKHLYQVGPGNRRRASQITKGRMDREGDRPHRRRQVARSGSGRVARTPDQDPYFIHHYRISFDGS